MGIALGDLTTSNNQLRADANYEFNGFGNSNSIVATTNASYDAARTSANTAWSDLQSQVGQMVLAAGNANSAAVTASSNLLSQLDTDFTTVTNVLVQASSDIFALRTTIISQTGAEFPQHAKDWEKGWLQHFEDATLQPISTVGGYMMMVPIPMVSAVGAGLVIGANGVGAYVNWLQGDWSGMGGNAFEIVMAVAGVGGRARQASSSGCTMLRRLVGGGCFRASTGVHGIGLEFDDGSVRWTLPPRVFESNDSPPPIVITPTEESNASSLIWVAFVAGFVSQRGYRRRKRRRHRQQAAETNAIDSLFGSAPRDNSFWN